MTQAGSREDTISQDTADLHKLGYAENEIEEIIRYAVGHGTLSGAPGINHVALKAKGFTTGAIQSVENALATAFDIRFVFNKWTLGEEFCQAALNLTAEQLNEPTFDMLATLGFTNPVVRARVTDASGEDELRVAVTVVGAGPPPNPDDPIASTRVEAVQVVATTPDGVVVRGARFDLQRLLWP